MVDTISSCIRFRLRSSTHLLAPLSGRMRMGVGGGQRGWRDGSSGVVYSASISFDNDDDSGNQRWLGASGFILDPGHAMPINVNESIPGCRGSPRYSLGSHRTSQFSVSLIQLHRCNPFTLNCGQARSRLKPVS